jgi:hypothetical protein
MEINWHDITHLKLGNERQKNAYSVLNKLKIFKILREYNPTLVGTIPIEIDISESDLDIICEVYDLEEFEELVIKSFNKYADFHIKRQIVKGLLTSLSYFGYSNFLIEIFGQPKPVIEQNGYRHMMVEKKLLEISGESARKQIIKLKKLGLKTEPAFAKYFNLKSDPFDELLKLSRLNKEELILFLKKKNYGGDNA